MWSFGWQNGRQFTSDSSGALASVTDSATGITTTYYYDYTDRLLRYAEKGSDFSHIVGYEYDAINNLTALVETINGTEYKTAYGYDDDNRVTSVGNGSASEAYTYDAYSRVQEKVTKNGDTTVLTDTFTYRAPTTATTSGQVHELQSVASGYNVTYTYTYDDNGNILSVGDGTSITSYVYDSAGQLIRENNQAANKTWIWTYDNAGNILSRSEYAYTTGELGEASDTVVYGYDDSDWGDLLTAYDGQTITYDGIGNPLSDGTWTYTWEHGRELASMSNGSTTWTNTYNADGLRTKRTNGTTTYSYVYNGSSLSQMTVGSNTLYFAYDVSGTPMSVTYNGTAYYYATNLQGDVTAILNTSGTAVVTYTYDAWGNILTTTGTMAETLGAVNPLRYRGYVYDHETGLYYVSSRYYDPEIGRFINADALASTGQGLLGNNMFAYCLNNPVLHVDFNGNKAEVATDEDRYRFVGIGFQGELDVGSYEVGFEIIVYYDELVCGEKKPLVAVYLYEGAFVDREDIMKNTNYLQTIEKLTLAIMTNTIDEQNAEALLTALQATLFQDVGVSGSLVGIFGNNKFTSTEDYAGPFTTYAATLYHAKVSVSTSSSCFAIAVGVSTEFFDISFGQSNYVQVY